MQICRITSLYLVRKSLQPEYMLCSSFYRIDTNIFTRMRTLCSAEQNGTENNVIKRKQIAPQLHLSPSRSFSGADIAKQILSVFHTVKMEDLAKAPKPVFWYSTAALIPFVLPPLSFITLGYSPFLSTLQLTYAATLSAFAGGMKWGYALNETEHQPTWENLGWSIVPQMLGWFGLLVPQPLGYLVVMSAIAVSAFIDLTSTCYPCWFKSIRLALTIPALLSLLLTFLLRIFH